jgi:hypothetical protein
MKEFEVFEQNYLQQMYKENTSGTAKQTLRYLALEWRDLWLQKKLSIQLHSVVQRNVTKSVLHSH